MQNHDEIRKLLLQEPRGYPCQNMNILYKREVSDDKFFFCIAAGVLDTNEVKILIV